jgi:hypothetical protein
MVPDVPTCKCGRKPVETGSAKAAKRRDANEDDNSAGLVLDTDVVARLVKRLREFSDLRPRGTGVRQGNR